VSVADLVVSFRMVCRRATSANVLPRPSGSRSSSAHVAPSMVSALAFTLNV
jgi:hypothetical protein